MTQQTALRPASVGQLNERQVFRVIRSAGPLSRAEVARRTGLSAPTVSKAAASLLAAGLLEESAPNPANGPARGRPAPELRLATERAQVLGVVVDAGRCRVVSAGLDGALHPDPDPTVPTPDTYAGLLAALEDRCRAVMGKPGVATLGLGVSLPGLIDDRKGLGVLSPNVPLTDGRRPAADLGDRLGVDAVLLQESHALCLAERHHGPAAGLDDFAVLDTSTGVGLGVMLGGRLLKGHTGLAGEIGHVTVVPAGGRRCGCGNRGCLETVCSDPAFAWRVGRKLGRPVAVDEAIDLARAGRAADAVREAAEFLAVAVAAVVNLFNPATVFVHSRQLDADLGLLERVVASARGRALPPAFADCAVVRAAGTKWQGAVAGAVQHLTNAVAPGLGHI